MEFRHEYKHQINLADIYGLRTRLSAVAKHDPHADEDGTYFIKKTGLMEGNIYLWVRSSRRRL